MFFFLVPRVRLVRFGLSRLYLLYCRSRQKVVRNSGKEQAMQQRRQVWRYLIAVFVAFWLLFAVVLVTADIPFFVISIALTTVGTLSVLVVILAWAYQNNV